MKTIRQIEQRVERDAKRFGWDLNLDAIASTGTLYYTLYWCYDDPEYGEDVAAAFKLRIGDHGSAHCSEDISLVPDGREGGDDADYAAFLRRLREPSLSLYTGD